MTCSVVMWSLFKIFLTRSKLIIGNRLFLPALENPIAVRRSLRVAIVKIVTNQH